MIQTQATLVDIEYSPNKQVAFLYFKPDTIFQFKEGQFIFLERLGFSYPDGKAMKNAYSIGTTNSMLQNQGIVGTIVKKSSEGGMSEYLTQGMQIGDEIKCTGPLGHFVDKELSKNYLFISIGSGITPLFSLYTTLLENKNFDKIVNIFGERTKDLLLPSVVEAYNTQIPKVSQFLCLSQEKDLPECWKSGRIQQSLQNVASLFANEPFQAFLCGNPTMVDDAVAMLLKQGVAKDHIFFEKY